MHAGTILDTTYKVCLLKVNLCTPHYVSGVYRLTRGLDSSRPYHLANRCLRAQEERLRHDLCN